MKRSTTPTLFAASGIVVAVMAACGPAERELSPAGQAGSAGAAGTSGTSGPSVACGATTCTQGKACCGWIGDVTSMACGKLDPTVPGDPCDFGTSKGHFFATCDSGSDCQPGEVCCYIFGNYASSLTCAKPADGLCAALGCRSASDCAPNQQCVLEQSGNGFSICK